jgi:hypothetical protein
MSNRIVSILLRGRVVKTVKFLDLFRVVPYRVFVLVFCFVPNRSVYEKPCINRVTWFANIPGEIISKLQRRPS